MLTLARMYLLFLALLALASASFAGEVTEDTLVCGNVSGTYEVGDDVMPVFSGVEDADDDQYVRPEERKSGKERSFRIETFNYIHTGDVRIRRKQTHDSERTISDRDMAKLDFQSLVTKKVPEVDLCIFGDVIWKRYDRKYYLRPKRFVAYTRKLDLLLPSELIGSYSGTIAVKGRTDEAEHTVSVSQATNGKLDLDSVARLLLGQSSVSCAKQKDFEPVFIRDNHDRLSVQIGLENASTKKCTATLTVGFSKSKKARISIEAKLDHAASKHDLSYSAKKLTAQ